MEERSKDSLLPGLPDLMDFEGPLGGDLRGLVELLPAPPPLPPLPLAAYMRLLEKGKGGGGK